MIIRPKNPQPTPNINECGSTTPPYKNTMWIIYNFELHFNPNLANSKIHTTASPVSYTTNADWSNLGLHQSTSTTTKKKKETHQVRTPVNSERIVSYFHQTYPSCNCTTCCCDSHFVLHRAVRRYLVDEIAGRRGRTRRLLCWEIITVVYLPSR